jgi:hypothetical protein
MTIMIKKIVPQRFCFDKIVLKIEPLLSRPLLDATFFDLNNDTDTQLSIKNITTRMVNSVLAFSLGICAAFPEAMIPIFFAKINEFALSKISAPDIFKKSIPIITAFVTYPLAYESINTLKQPGPCNDLDFCGGYLEGWVEGYYRLIHTGMSHLQPQNNEYQPLPLFNPTLIYEQTSTIAYTLFTSLVGTQFGIKLSAPHIEILANEV